MIEGNVEAIKTIAKLCKEFDGTFSSSITTGYLTSGMDKTQLFLPRDEMRCIAQELGVELKSSINTLDEAKEWIYFIFEGVEFGSLVYLEAIENTLKEELKNG